MGFLLSLLGLDSLKGKIIAALIIAGLLGGGYFVYQQKMQLLKANEERVQMKAERDQAFIDREKAVDAAKTTNETLEKVLQERKDAEDAAKKLAAKDKANKVKIDQLNTIIDGLASQPESKVELSPILKETVRKIQTDRDTQGESK